MVTPPPYPTVGNVTEKITRWPPILPFSSGIHRQATSCRTQRLMYAAAHSCQSVPTS